MYDETINRFNEITLYELMGEDFDVWVTINNSGGFHLQMDDENYQTIVDEKDVHPCAMESFADLCARFLKSYETAKARQAMMVEA